MEKEIIKTSKELFDMMNNLIKYSQSNECNVFEEIRLFTYANNGMVKLKKLNVSDDTLVKMYDIDNELYFEKIESEMK